MYMDISYILHSLHKRFIPDPHLKSFIKSNVPEDMKTSSRIKIDRRPPKGETQRGIQQNIQFGRSCFASEPLKINISSGPPSRIPPFWDGDEHPTSASGLLECEINTVNKCYLRDEIRYLRFTEIGWTILYCPMLTVLIWMRPLCVYRNHVLQNRDSRHRWSGTSEWGWDMCMCVYMYIYIYIYIFLFVCVYIYIYICIYIT